ncbi:MAG: ATP-binding protein [Pseudomonadota bacterium]
MSDWLNSIIIWFVGISGAFTVPPPDEHWEVTKKWQLVEDVYVFEAVNQDLATRCADNPTLYINFPQATEATQRVLAEGVIIAQHGSPESQAIKSYYGAPVVQCAQVQGRSLTWQVFSHARYFARINSYPTVSQSPLADNFFNETLNIVAAGVLLVLCALYFIIFYKKTANRLCFLLCASCALLSVYFISTTPEYFSLKVSHLALHKLGDSSLWLGVMCLGWCFHELGVAAKRTVQAYSVFLLLACAIILLSDSLDVAQFGTSVPFVATLIFFAYCILRIFNGIFRDGLSTYSLFIMLSLSVFFGTTINDILVIQNAITGHMIFSLGAVACLFFFALSLNVHIINTYHERDALIKTLKLEEESNRQKDLFLANVSHEIRTPLNSISALSGMLLRQNDLGANYGHIKRINAAATHLSGIIGNILDLSRINAGKVSIGNHPMDVRNLVANVKDILLPNLDERSVRLELAVDEKIAKRIMCDELRLTQVMLNLGYNAVKFTRNGHIKITVSRHFENDAAMLLFKVEDTGIGIPEASLSKLFVPFTQVDNTITKQYRGAGLGLSISAELVRLMGGKIGVHSKVGEGSCFWFTIPYQEAPEEPDRHDAHVSERSDVSGGALLADTRFKVLIAEDDAITQYILKELFKQLGTEYKIECMCTLVEDGQQALDELLTNQYDLALLDYQMPKLDGITVAKKLHSHAHAPRKIIVQSAYVTPEMIDESKSFGFILKAKPIDIAYLLTQLNGLRTTPASPI